MAIKNKSLKERVGEYQRYGLVAYKACDGIRPNDRRIVVLTIGSISRVRYVDLAGDHHIATVDMITVSNVLPDSKMRASIAFVREVLDARGHRVPEREAVAFSRYDHSFSYRTNHTVEPDHWNDNSSIECGGGIHFFLTMERAISWSQHH